MTALRRVAQLTALRRVAQLTARRRVAQLQDRPLPVRWDHATGWVRTKSTKP